MRKGVILEINDLYLTLLTPEGEFLRARKLQQEYVVGEEIHFFPEMSVDKRKIVNLSFLNSFKARTIALAAALMLVMTAFLPVYQSGQVYAYMSIDVNPSIELAVSDELKVLRLTGYNPEGKEIIKEIQDWKKKDAAEVAEMVLDKIEEKGFFDQKNDVVIATVHNGKAKAAVDRKLDQKISEIKKATQEEKLELKVMEGTSEERKNAKKQGVTTGVYKERQSEKAKPVTTPAQPKKGTEPEGNQIKPAAPLKPQPKPEQTSKTKPNKQEPPGQLKKMPEPPKVAPGKPNSASDKNKGREKKENRENDKGNKKEGNGTIHDKNKGQKYANRNRNDQSKKVKKEIRDNNSHNQQRSKDKPKGQTSRYEDHKHKK
jgi:hypothetical protein